MSDDIAIKERKKLIGSEKQLEALKVKKIEALNTALPLLVEQTQRIVNELENILHDLETATEGKQQNEQITTKRDTTNRPKA